MEHKRLDVRIPVDIYKRIEALAIATEQPIAPKTGKPSLAPIVVRLLWLGLEYLDQDNEMQAKFTPRELELKDYIVSEIEKIILEAKNI